MSDQELWGASLIAVSLLSFGSLLIRSYGNENFNVGRFDAISIGLLVFLIFAASVGWRLIPSVLTGAAAAVAATAVTQIPWKALLARANTRSRRGLLVAAPFFTVSALYRLAIDLDRYAWEPSLAFIILTMLSGLCFLLALTRLYDWLMS